MYIGTYLPGGGGRGIGCDQSSRSRWKLHVERGRKVAIIEWVCSIGIGFSCDTSQLIEWRDVAWFVVSRLQSYFHLSREIISEMGI